MKPQGDGKVISSW